jgi:hypothetical protein
VIQSRSNPRVPSFGSLGAFSTTCSCVSCFSPCYRGSKSFPGSQGSVRQSRQIGNNRLSPDSHAKLTEVTRTRRCTGSGMCEGTLPWRWPARCRRPCRGGMWHYDCSAIERSIHIQTLSDLFPRWTGARIVPSHQKAKWSRFRKIKGYFLIKFKMRQL